MQGFAVVSTSEPSLAGPVEQQASVVHHFSYGEHSSAGMRRTMEDYTDTYTDGEYQAFAVYDGHGGTHVAEHCSKLFLKHLIQNLRASHDNIEECFKSAYDTFNNGILAVTEWNDVGACVVSAVIKHLPDGSHLLMLANCGDCYAVLGCKSSSEEECSAVLLSTEHSPWDRSEIERVHQLGGACGGGRLWGRYAHAGVSRSMGDHSFVNGDNGKGMTCEPAVFVRKITGDDLFVLLGSDGLLVRGSLEQTEVSQYVYKRLKSGCSAQQASVDVVRFALSRGSWDNVSAVVVRLAEDF